MRKLLLVAIILLLSLSRAWADPCAARPGLPVSLFGGVDDPDVLLWDSRARLSAFAAGSDDARKFLLPHALLIRPGTRARVLRCVEGAVYSKFHMTPEDAVGVLILSGQYRGRYGWASSYDVHGRGIPEPVEQW